MKPPSQYRTARAEDRLSDAFDPKFPQHSVNAKLAKMLLARL